MPVKRLSGSTVNSDLGRVGRTIGGAASSLADTLQSLGGFAIKAANPYSLFNENHPVDKMPSISQGARKAFGVTEEQLKPRGIGEEVVQGILSQAPLAALGGGGIANAIGRTAAGVAAGSAAKHLGAPSAVQGAVQLGTELFGPGLVNKAKALAKKGKGIGYVAKELHPAQQLKRTLYDEATSSLKPNERGSTKAWEPVKSALEKSLGVETDASVEKLVNETLGKIESNFSKPAKNANIADVWGSLKALRKQISGLPQKSGAKSYLEQAATGLNDILEDYRPFNESFWKNRTDANKLHTIQQWKPLLSQIGDTLSSKGSVLGKVKLPAQLFFNALGEGHRAINYIKIPAARHYLGKAIHEQLMEHPVAAVNAFKRFLKENEKSSKEKAGGPKRISGNTIS